MKIPKELPSPLFIRPNDYVSIAGVDFIIKRNEFAQMTKVIGRVSRRLPSDKDVIWALTARKPVAYWGSKYFIYETIDHEIVEPIKQTIWEADRRRGIPIPELKPDEDLYDF